MVLPSVSVLELISLEFEKMVSFLLYLLNRILLKSSSFSMEAFGYPEIQFELLTSFPLITNFQIEEAVSQPLNGETNEVFLAFLSVIMGFCMSIDARRYALFFLFMFKLSLFQPPGAPSIWLLCPLTWH